MLKKRMAMGILAGLLACSLLPAVAGVTKAPASLLNRNRLLLI